MTCFQRIIMLSFDFLLAHCFLEFWAFLINEKHVPVLFPCVLSHTDVRENLFTTALLFEVTETDHEQKVKGFSNNRDVKLGHIMKQLGHNVCVTSPRIMLLSYLQVICRTTPHQEGFSKPLIRSESTDSATAQCTD